MLTRYSGYPRNQHGMVRQCAWCHAVADAAGAFVLQATALLSDATHGLCPPCKTAVLREIDAMPHSWELPDLRHAAAA